MEILVAATIFIATVMGGLALFWWTESRRESLPQRIKEVVSTSGEPRRGVLGIGARWLSETRKRFASRLVEKEEIVAMFSGKELSGPRLLLHRAGYRSPVAFRIYWSVKAGLPVFLAVAAYLGGKSAGLANPLVLLLTLMGSIGGYVAPDFFLKMNVRKRQEQITDSLPDGLDLLVVCVEAGMGLNASFVKITEEFRMTAPVLSEEFDVVNREMVAGKPRQEALRALADRTGVEEVKSLVAMLIQTERLGTSLSQSLRVHSDSLRTRRRQRAEEAAAKTTIKLVFPLVFLLFPALFAVILGPAAMQIVKVLFGEIQR